MKRRDRFPGPLPSWLRPLGPAMSHVYAIAQRSDERRRADPGRSRRVPIPVISVGNLSTGGTGKTPMVVAITKHLLEQGRRPAIAMRGYTKGGRDGAGSDEALAYQSDLPTVPVLADPDRAAAIVAALDPPVRDGTRGGVQGVDVESSPDVVVLDDGFQHRRLHRDLDIVVIDATRSPFRDRLLPDGWLREPIEALARADAFCLTHADRAGDRACDEIERRLEEIAPGRPTARCAHVWSSAIDINEAGIERGGSVEALQGRRVLAVCAIGSPDGFFAGVERAVDGPIAKRIALSDHDPYRAATRRRVLKAALDAKADAIVMTPKDWVKWQGHEQGAGSPTIVRPRLALRFEAGQEALFAAIDAATFGS